MLNLHNASKRLRIVASQFILLSLATMQPGCMNRSDAASLATLGTKATALGTDAILELRGELAAYRETDIVVSTLTGRGKLTKPELEQLGKLDAQLQKRSQMLGSMSALYYSFQQLADYDAAANVRDASKQLTTASVNLIELLGENNIEASDQLANLIGEGAALIAEGVQSRKLYKANNGFIRLLPELTKLLKKERDLYPVAQESFVNRYKQLSAQRLIDFGLAKVDSLIEEQVSHAGLTYDAKLVSDLRAESRKYASGLAAVTDTSLTTAQKNTLHAAIAPFKASHEQYGTLKTIAREVLSLRYQTELELHTSIMDETITALDKLYNSHLSAKAKSKKLDVTALAAVVKRLAILAEQANAYAAARRAASEEARATRLEVKNKRRAELEAALSPLIDMWLKKAGIVLPDLSGTP